MISDACRIRVVRALMGLTSRDFAAKIGVTPGVVTSWEKGRYTPQRRSRTRLAEICHEAKIMFLPSGMPVPSEDFIPTQEEINAGESVGSPANQ